MNPSLKKSFFRSPSQVLLVTQFFSTISFAVLYSTLVLFMTQHLHMSSQNANSVMGLYIAFNYGLHLLGGYIGGRLLSYRNLFVLGMILQVAAVLLLGAATQSSLYLALALFLTGSGLNVPCINMMLTQQFSPESLQRETAFIWNYAGMNVGFLLGFFVAGIFQLKQAFSVLFVLTSITNLASAVIIFLGWNAVKDRCTPLSRAIEKKQTNTVRRGIWGLLVIVAVFFALIFLLRHAAGTNIFILAISVSMFLLFIYLGLIEKDQQARRKIFAYVVLGLAGMVFWPLYQLAPMGLTLFAMHNVNRNLFGFTVPPQWIQNINTIIIAIGGLVLPPLFKKIRRYYILCYPIQFVFSLLFIGLGMVVLSIGIAFANSKGLSNFSWITVSYIFQSLGELFIGPIGYAMIGLLATESLQGLMMGSWMLISGGSAGVIASYLSNYAIVSSNTNNPLVTNPGYSHVFLIIGIIALISSVILAFFVPFLRRLIGYNEKASA